ncbi:hypothetical protein BST81_22595 [Leptolyngbya sp. 'hensonii']|nr:hypothetical protein BST81_22595 [Leptolyngbya sp. 'hensonii']
MGSALDWFQLENRGKFRGFLPRMLISGLFTKPRRLLNLQFGYQGKFVESPSSLTTITGQSRLNHRNFLVKD